jgi:hypothetical protein
MDIPIKNIGRSVALNICLNLYKIGDASPFNRSCDEGSPFVRLSLKNSQSYDVPIENVINLEHILGFRPRSVHILKIGDESISCPSSSFGSLLLRVQYSDILHHEYNDLYTLLLCRKS